MKHESDDGATFYKSVVRNLTEPHAPLAKARGRKRKPFITFYTFRGKERVFGRFETWEQAAESRQSRLKQGISTSISYYGIVCNEKDPLTLK